MPKKNPPPPAKVVHNSKNEAFQQRLLIGTASRGNVRIEWMMSRLSLITPCNWSAGQNLQYVPMYAPVGYMVADAQNVIVKEAIEKNYEWLLLLEDDTVPPPDMFVRMNKYMREGEVPVLSGLYYTKGNPSEPLLYRGQGNSFYDKWKMGDKVWVDGIPTGCFLCHMSVMKLMWDESEEYMAGNVLTRRVFNQPESVWYDPESNMLNCQVGTSDLAWCDRVIKEKVLRRAGWEKVGRRKYPFLVDTNIFCRHIDGSGLMYPLGI